MTLHVMSEATQKQVPEGATTVYAPTPDGWKVALHRVPSAAPIPRKYPVLMIHGLGANRINMDLSERHSVARAVARRGFDVWVLELRGAGMTVAPGDKDPTQFEWGIQDYIRYDLPAAIRCVLSQTGASAVHGMGHSMGGMVFYAHATGRPEHLRSILSVGTPLVSELTFGRRERRLINLAMRLSPDRVVKTLPLKALLSAASKIAPLSNRLADGVLLNGANTESEVMVQMAKEAIADVPLRLVLEMTHHMSHGVNGGGEDAPYFYESALGDIEIPVMAMSGSVDRVAPPAAVYAAVKRIRSADVRYREMGTRFGDRADYGHIDLLVGRHAPDEVFPLILDFLEEVD